MNSKIHLDVNLDVDSMSLRDEITERSLFLPVITTAKHRAVRTTTTVPVDGFILHE